MRVHWDARRRKMHFEPNRASESESIPPMPADPKPPRVRIQRCPKPRTTPKPQKAQAQPPTAEVKQIRVVRSSRQKPPELQFHSKPLPPPPPKHILFADRKAAAALALKQKTERKKKRKARKKKEKERKRKERRRQKETAQMRGPSLHSQSMQTLNVQNSAMQTSDALPALIESVHSIDDDTVAIRGDSLMTSHNSQIRELDSFCDDVLSHRSL